jgi:hypothetical protein
MAEKVAAGEVVFSRAAHTEVGQVAPDCRDWLDDHGCTIIEPNNAIVQTAVAIKDDLGIVNPAAP